MRAFIALTLPSAVLQRVTSTQRRLAQQLHSRQLAQCVRWTPAENLHLTLRFLGEIDEVQRDALATRLAQLAQQQPCLTLSAGGLGCFPNPRRPSVIWCGVHGEIARLNSLQGSIENAARAVGLLPEEKAFKPHLTIGRLQRSARSDQLQAVGALVTQLAATTPVTSGDTTTPANELLLIHSELTPSGPLYTPLGVYPLTGATTAPAT